MLVQQYSLPFKDDEPEPGQAVFLGDEDDTVRGFISEFNARTQVAVITMFEPVELTLPPAAVLIHSFCGDVMPIFTEVLTKASPEVKRWWKEACRWTAASDADLGRN